MDPQWHPAVLSSPLEGNRIRCELCPERCELAQDETGPCAVRRNTDGHLVTATFAVSVTHLDPIERKPFYHVRPGTHVLTIAAPGCTFRCNYCINHRLSQYGRVPTVAWSARPADVDTLTARAATANAMIGMSYTEPALAPELTLALADRGTPIVWKTNGFLTSKAIDLVAPHLTAVNIDLKAADDRAHQRLTGARLAPVLDAIHAFRERKVWVEVSTPLIPTVSDSPETLRRIARHIAATDPDIPWHLLRFTPDFRMARHTPTPPAALKQAADIGREQGLRYVYVERALGQAARNTYCPRCGECVISRGIWEIMSCALVGGACPTCRTPVPGRWS